MLCRASIHIFVTPRCSLGVVCLKFSGFRLQMLATLCNLRLPLYVNGHEEESPNLRAVLRKEELRYHVYCRNLRQWNPSRLACWPDCASFIRQGKRARQPNALIGTDSHTEHDTPILDLPPPDFFAIWSRGEASSALCLNTLLSKISQ